MESLNYAFEGKEPLFTGDANFPIENLIRSRNLIADSVESMGFIEPNVPNDIRKRPVLADKFFKYSAEASEHRSGNMVSAKRVRITDSKSQSPSCQVYGCNKDLSDSKDYHKRHKVCDVHSKTAVVVVNGIQQRFCQQCSRFHVLAEFDEGKRSCRKRLAGHNERRRKPQFNAHVFGSTFGSGLSKTSLFFSGFLPSRFFGSGPMKDNMIVKSEHDELAVPLGFCHSSVQERLSASSISSCALSLLSAQSQNISNGSINHPLIFRQSQSLRKSRKHELENSTVVDSFNGINHDGLPLICNEGVESLNSNHSVSQESGNTVDLVGLSLHLQRIEQQKHYDARVQMQDI